MIFANVKEFSIYSRFNCYNRTKSFDESFENNSNESRTLNL